MRLLLLCILCLVGGSSLAQVVHRFPPRPASGFVLDNANVLHVSTAAEINRISGDLNRTAKAPIVVVTLSSIASMNVQDSQLETYATELFNQWGIGSKDSNRGILVLVAIEDRRMRIETGSGWAHSRDAECTKIIDSWMTPSFKSGDYDGGILSGVQALSSMVSTGKLPPVPKPFWFWPAIGLGSLLVTLAIVDLVRRKGSSVLGQLFASGSSSDSGYGYRSRYGYRRSYYDDDDDSSSSSGDSSGYGGGSSGGGGASGSW